MWTLTLPSRVSPQSWRTVHVYVIDPDLSSFNSYTHKKEYRVEFVKRETVHLKDKNHQNKFGPWTSRRPILHILKIFQLFEKWRLCFNFFPINWRFCFSEKNARNIIFNPIESVVCEETIILPPWHIGTERF